MGIEDLLADKVAIVAGGGGGGIGAQTSRTLASAGAAVVVVDLESERAETLREEIEGQGGRALAVAADVRTVEGAESIVEATLAAFGRIDVRLAERLLTLAGEEPTLTTTHQQLASELGTAREVISRVLQDFQKRGLITQTRGHVTLTDRARLMALARAV